MSERLLARSINFCFFLNCNFWYSDLSGSSSIFWYSFLDWLLGDERFRRLSKKSFVFLLYFEQSMWLIFLKFFVFNTVFVNISWCFMLGVSVFSWASSSLRLSAILFSSSWWFNFLETFFCSRHFFSWFHNFNLFRFSSHFKLHFRYFLCKFFNWGILSGHQRYLFACFLHLIQNNGIITEFKYQIMFKISIILYWIILYGSKT